MCDRRRRSTDDRRRRASLFDPIGGAACHTSAVAVSGSSYGTVNELLVCPVCHGDLKLDEAMGVCSRCSRAYPAAAGIIDFTPRPPPESDVSLRWPLWEQLESNGRVSYENDPRNNLLVGQRAVC